MSTTLWNPNTPVWDQARGEPYIDPETGDAVLARPGLKVTAADGRVLDGDDVANSVYWQVNLFEGEVARARGIGVPYERLIFSPGTPVQAKLTIIMSEAQRVRGVGAILGARVTYYDPTRRALGFAGILRKRDGAVVPLESTLQG